jgi:hypothetical protein
METLTGSLKTVRVVPTKTNTLMVTFTVNGERCKAFGDIAKAIEGLEGRRVELACTKGLFQGAHEFNAKAVSVVSRSENSEVSKINREYDEMVKKWPQEVRDYHAFHERMRRQKGPLYSYTEEEQAEAMRLCKAADQAVKEQRAQLSAKVEQPSDAQGN